MRRLGHFVKPNLLDRSSSSSSPAVTVQLDLEHTYQYYKASLLRHQVSWKHLQEPADSARLEEFNEAIRQSDHMASSSAETDGVVERKRKAGRDRDRAANGGVGGGGPEKKAAPLRIILVGTTSRGAPNEREHALPEKISLAVPAAASGNADQASGSSSPPNPGSRKRIPSSRTTNRPSDPAVPAAEEPNGGMDDDDGDLCKLGMEIALGMTEDELRLELERQRLGVGHRLQEQRPHRRAVRQRRAAAAPAVNAEPVYFSLRLTDEEAAEDVAAVSLPVETLGNRTRKRRRGG